jgi:hypothetical protein
MLDYHSHRAAPARDDSQEEAAMTLALWLMLAGACGLVAARCAALAVDAWRAEAREGT